MLLAIAARDASVAAVLSASACSLAFCSCSAAAVSAPCLSTLAVTSSKKAPSEVGGRASGAGRALAGDGARASSEGGCLCGQGEAARENGEGAAGEAAGEAASDAAAGDGARGGVGEARTEKGVGGVGGLHGVGGLDGGFSLKGADGFGDGAEEVPLGCASICNQLPARGARAECAERVRGAHREAHSGEREQSGKQPSGMPKAKRPIQETVTAELAEEIETAEEGGEENETSEGAGEENETSEGVGEENEASECAGEGRKPEVAAFDGGYYLLPGVVHKRGEAVRVSSGAKMGEVASCKSGAVLLAKHGVGWEHVSILEPVEGQFLATLTFQLDAPGEETDDPLIHRRLNTAQAREHYSELVRKELLSAEDPMGVCYAACETVRPRHEGWTRYVSVPERAHVSYFEPHKSSKRVQPEKPAKMPRVEVDKFKVTVPAGATFPVDLQHYVDLQAELKAVKEHAAALEKLLEA